MDLVGDRVPARVWLAGIALAVAVTGALLYGWWQRRATFNEARERAVPACVEKLGEEACRAHLAQYHDDCARLTFHQRGNNPRQRGFVDQQAYLECVGLGPDAWVAENGRRHEREAQERAKQHRP